ncbi:MAG: hypothetical protein ACRDZ4_08855 [Egibacteraceae bacterium]
MSSCRSCQAGYMHDRATASIDGKVVAGAQAKAELADWVQWPLQTVGNRLAESLKCVLGNNRDPGRLPRAC